MQFLGKFGKIICWRPPLPGELVPPPRATDKWRIQDFEAYFWPNISVNYMKKNQVVKHPCSFWGVCTSGTRGWICLGEGPRRLIICKGWVYPEGVGVSRSSVDMAGWCDTQPTLETHGFHEIWLKNGRYGFYWNAFLLIFIQKSLNPSPILIGEGIQIPVEGCGTP